MEQFKNLSLDDQNEDWEADVPEDSKPATTPQMEPPISAWGRGRGRGRGFPHPAAAGTALEPAAARPRMMPNSDVSSPRPIGPTDVFRPYLGMGRGRGFFRGLAPKPVTMDIPGIVSEKQNQGNREDSTTGVKNVQTPEAKPAFKKGIPKAEDLAEVLQSTDKADIHFCIANFHVKRHNRFNIITKKRLSLMIRVKDEMNMHTAEAEKLKTEPRVGDVVVVRHPDPKVGNHIRAYVRAIHDKFPDLVHIACVDLGRQYVLPWREMWAPNEFILAFAPFGYEVEVDGIDDFSPLIFYEDYSDLVQDLFNRPQKVNIVGKTDDGLYRVSLTNEKEVGAHKLFSTWINNLKKFEWEKTFDIGMYKNDEEIINRGRWLEDYEGYRNAFLPSVVPFEAVIVGAGGSEEPENESNMFIKPIHEYMDVHAQTLEAQLERYMTMVKPRPFYPCVLEEFCGLLPEKYNCGNKWRRLIRLDIPGQHVHYDVDSHVPFEVDPREDAIQYRMMCPEFFRIPKLVMDVNVFYGGLKDEVYKSVFAQTFAVGQKLWFTLYEDDEDLLDEEVVAVRCREFEERLAKERQRIVNSG